MMRRVVFGCTVFGINISNLRSSPLFPNENDGFIKKMWSLTPWTRSCYEERENEKNIRTKQVESLVGVCALKGILYAVAYPIAPIVIVYDLWNYRTNGVVDWKSHFIPGSKYLELDENKKLTYNGRVWTRWV